MQWIEWTRCPQCGQIAEVVDRDVLPSTDGPVEHVHVRCVARHRFVMPVVSLARDPEASTTTAPERELVRVRVHRADDGNRG
jgi:hypothetical protein